MSATTHVRAKHERRAPAGRSTMLPNILRRTLRDQRRALIGWSVGVVALVLLYSAFYPSVRDNAAELDRYVRNLPEAFKQAIGGDLSYGTGTGYLQSEVFAITGPLLLLIFAIGAGARAIAGEEESQTLDVLLSTPVTRLRVATEKFAALVAATALLGVFLWGAVVLFGSLFDLHVPAGNAAAATLEMTLLAIAFGSIAFGLGCALGRRGLAIGIAAAVAVASYVINLLVPSIESIEPLRTLSPFYYYLQGSPLQNGLDLGHAAVLAGIALVACGLGLVAFDRRDLAA